MKVEIRYPEEGACGLRLFIYDVYIPRVKEIKVKPEIFFDYGVERTEKGYEVDCDAVELRDDETGIIATIIRGMRE